MDCLEDWKRKTRVRKQDRERTASVDANITHAIHGLQKP